MNKHRGFTLVEIMIVVAIVGILSAVAVPMYTSYMARGKLVDAQSTLTSGRVAMEQYFQDHRTYVNATCPGATDYFTYGCSTAASTFTITATNRASVGLGDAGSYVYTINESNTKTTTAFPKATVPVNTWISK